MTEKKSKKGILFKLFSNFSKPTVDSKKEKQDFDKDQKNRELENGTNIKEKSETPGGTRKNEEEKKRSGNETNFKFLTIPSEGVFNDGKDNKQHNLIVRKNDILGGHYIVKSLLGGGVYGQVFRCIDLNQNIYHSESSDDSEEEEFKKPKAEVAIKVIKNHPDFNRQAEIEIDILDEINRELRIEKRRILKYHGSFVHENHRCIATELLGKNLFELLRDYNNFKGFPIFQVSNIIKQLLVCFDGLSMHSIIHCDLKPENILIEKVISSKNSKTKEVEENVRVKVIDFGSATYENQTTAMYVQSRFYRAPEILFFKGYYGTEIDVWSIGIICAELFLGLPLFPGRSGYDQVSKIQKLLGTPPDWIFERDKFALNYYDLVPDKNNPDSVKYVLKDEETYSNATGESVNKHPGYFSGSTLSEIINSKKYMKKTKYFSEKAKELAFLMKNTKEKRKGEDLIFKTDSSGDGSIIELETDDSDLEDEIIEIEMNEEEKKIEQNRRDALIDFLSGILVYDTEKRWNIKQLLLHPFITGEKFEKPYQPKRYFLKSTTGQKIKNQRTMIMDSNFQKQKRKNSIKKIEEFGRTQSSNQKPKRNRNRSYSQNGNNVGYNYGYSYGMNNGMQMGSVGGFNGGSSFIKPQVGFSPTNYNSFEYVNPYNSPHNVKTFTSSSPMNPFYPSPERNPNNQFLAPPVYNSFNSPNQYQVYSPPNQGQYPTQIQDQLYHQYNSPFTNSYSVGSSASNHMYGNSYGNGNGNGNKRENKGGKSYNGNILNLIDFNKQRQFSNQQRPKKQNHNQKNFSYSHNHHQHHKNHRNGSHYSSKKNGKGRQRRKSELRHNYKYKPKQNNHYQSKKHKRRSVGSSFFNKHNYNPNKLYGGKKNGNRNEGYGYYSNNMYNNNQFYSPKGRKKKKYNSKKTKKFEENSSEEEFQFKMDLSPTNKVKTKPVVKGHEI